MVTRVCVFLSLVTSVTALFQPPVIFSEPAYEVYFKSGESVQLSCVANGEPRPQYRWKRNEIELSPIGNDARVVQLPNAGTLVINSAEDKDEGIYQCFLTNSLGTAASKKVKLIQAKLSEFAYAPPIYLTPTIGEPLTLPCVLPASVPPALVFWINLEETGGIDVYNYDNRVSMDREFRLRFANVRAEDRKGGLAYVCVAMNPVMGQSSRGPLFYISPIGPGGTSRVKYLWADQEDRSGLVGNTFSLKCIFSGNPTPEVHWERLENKTLPDRASVKSFGQELEITNLQFEDAGAYECWATNSVNGGYREIRSFNVSVKSKPQFLEEPKDIEMGVGANAEFTCIAKGDPEPDIDWFIDGVALRGPRFKRPLETKIVLENVQLSDDMVFQCDASNIHGYVFANAYLNVLAC